MQLTLFDCTEKSIIPEIIEDIRSEKQKNHKVAYDVGEKIGHSRKDLAAARKVRFLENPTLTDLDVFEEDDVALAAELVTRDTFFSPFHLKMLKEKGVEPVAAKALDLLIKRIPKSPEDSRKARNHYMNACLYLSEKFEHIQTMEDFNMVDRQIKRVFRNERRWTVERLKSRKDSILEGINDERDIKNIRILEKQLAELPTEEEVIFANELALSKLGDKFLNFYYKSRVTINKNLDSIKTWDDLLPTTTVGKKNTKSNKPAWERELPERPDRKGGMPISILDPKEFVSHFGFRGSEFGNYIDDEKGKEHLFRSSEAYTDLAELLNISADSVSLRGTLGMAFGARGRGSALGHYEPARKVINLTKERGSLGILAHEWFHALDCHLFDLSFNNQNGKIGFLTEQNFGPHLSEEIGEAVKDLMNSMMEGKSTAYLDVSERKGIYRLALGFRKIYENYNGDLKAIMDARMGEFDKRVSSTLKGYIFPSAYKEVEAKYARKRKRYLKSEAEALSQLHEEVTGEKVTLIPYTAEQSNYYTASVALDKGKKGKYWSSSIEMAARAFESYIFELLLERGWISDYLVCGARGNVFPQGEEREAIKIAFNKLIALITPLLEMRD